MGIWNGLERRKRDLDEFGDTMDRFQYTARVGEVYLTGAYESRIENFVGEQDDFHGFVGQVLTKPSKPVSEPHTTCEC